MIKFRYNDYLSQFVNTRGKCRGRATQEEKSRWGNHSDVTSGLETNMDPLLAAIKNGDVQRVHELATSCPLSLNENIDGWLPLHYAASIGKTECLKTLLKVHPESVDKRTLKEETALFLAVSREYLSCAQCLLQSGADPDICDIDKTTPLLKACEIENEDMVSLLLSYGANVNQRCRQSWTALLEAVNTKNIEICEMLLNAGAMINLTNAYSFSPLHVATRIGYLKAVRFLIEKGADVHMENYSGLTALHEACIHGFKDIVVTLLSKKADTCKYDNTKRLPIHYAAEYGHHEIVSLLLPMTRLHSTVSPLYLAAVHNRPSVATVMLQTGAEVNAPFLQTFDKHAKSCTPLFTAVSCSSKETVEVLLKAGARLDIDMYSPFLLAASRNCTRTVNLLLQHGANVNTKMSCNPTAFPTAIAFCLDLKRLPLLKLLLDNGFDARACFTCEYGAEAHPDSHCVSTCISSAHTRTPAYCSTPHTRPMQFCELLSGCQKSNWAGPLLDLLLEHVGQVQLCSKLTELLDSSEEWKAIKTKSLSPRSLMHLCRAKIRTQMRGHIPRSVSSLPLPDRILSYLNVTP
ncbi:hypothetical protein WMY93_017351 [Mugilogobius chulae]|uniref:SOCS box domain-containing protein n=1 Tax=Mugilogobius chulae TaxID=88201 RepID=A0AAW0P041_9GOBI